MKVQEITVSTKGGFIAALECARHIGSNFSLAQPTLITLVRKSGNTTYWYDAFTEDKVINRAKRLARAMPAKDLLA